MDINKHLKNGFLKVKVTPKSSSQKLIVKNNQLHLYLKSPPEKDKANHELIKFFKKEFNLRVEIKKGKKGREKLLKIEG